MQMEKNVPDCNIPVLFGNKLKAKSKKIDATIMQVLNPVDFIRNLQKLLNGEE